MLHLEFLVVYQLQTILINHHRQLVFFGGIGDKIILFSAASQINHPYSIGINLTSLWNSIPSGNTSIWTCIWIFNCISQFQQIQADSTDSIPTNTIPTQMAGH
jgi:hypothetical protein